MTRPFSVSRMRLIALLIVAAFTISTAVVATAYVASPASAAKKKKCKKGYKKVKKKCKKIKKKSANSVVSVELRDGTAKRGILKIVGDVTMKQAFAGKKLVQFSITTSTGTVVVGRNYTGVGSTRVKTFFQGSYKGDPPVKVFATVDGKQSNTLTINEG